MGVLKYTLAKGAKAPVKATSGAAGYDCFALNREFLTYKDGELVAVEPGHARQFDIVKYSTGVRLEIPEGYTGLTFARSSISKMPLIMANTTGVIDSDYRGEVIFMFRILNPEDITETAYKIGDRIGQLVLVELGDLELKISNKLSDTSRGSGAYGSTGL